MLLTDMDSREKVERLFLYAKDVMEHSQNVAECSLYRVPYILTLS